MCNYRGYLYFFLWVRRFFIKRFQITDARFLEMDAKFKKLDNRIFHLSMGKSLKDIIKEEREEKEMNNGKF